MMNRINIQIYIVILFFLIYIFENEVTYRIKETFLISGFDF